MANPKGHPATLKVPSSVEARLNGSKGGKASAMARQNYASLKECFKKKMTDEMKEEAFDKLWNLFIKHNNLNAFDKLKDLVEDEEQGTTNNVTIKFMSEGMEEYGD